MAKYMVLYNSDLSSSQIMANASPEEMKASMEEWMRWRDTARQKAEVEFGLPLEAVGHIAPDGVSDSATTVSGYSIIEADSRDDLLEVLKSHPQLKRQGASMDVLEMLSMPGL